ncbi:hypothetical protein Tpen_1357 [Thermofilum pendens Hrk 5]|uniref:Uncharacterized protein n=2 Tax=Thermofilum pendens TaxID=2269 RepID=A1RZX4_THEPD|nr:hypothetical protein Tpen_1357 [Thermofilum pendens Hrk 5]
MCIKLQHRDKRSYTRAKDILTPTSRLSCMAQQTSVKGLVERVLSPGSEDRAFLDQFVRYLAAYKVVEQNLSLFDRLARCRSVEEFASVLYECVRVKDRVLSRLEEGVRRGEYRLAFDAKAEDVGRVFNVGSEAVERVVRLAAENPRFVGSVLASLALSYGGIVEAERRG